MAGLGPLIAEVRGPIQSARHAAATTVNTLQVLTNFEIGRWIVEHEQKGAKRAAYGTELVKELSVRLTEEFGSGFSERNLDYMRKFFLAWRERFPSISQTPSAKFAPVQIPLTRSRKFKTDGSQAVFTLSWSHYVLLLTRSPLSCPTGEVGLRR
jgi:DUF1016 N-terminal domain